MKKTIKDILVDSLNEADAEKYTEISEKPEAETFMLFVLGIAAAIICKSATHISQSGETPTIRKCVKAIQDDSKLDAQICTVIYEILVAKAEADCNEWAKIESIMYNFQYVDKKILALIEEDEGDEDE